MLGLFRRWRGLGGGRLVLVNFGPSMATLVGDQVRSGLAAALQFERGQRRFRGPGREGSLHLAALEPFRQLTSPSACVNGNSEACN